jgi:ABC-type multidrug transport system ATPase subunit
MDQPVRTYSSGMKSRLGFAVAVNVDPDVLVLDEALSAGDAAFKKKSLQRMYDLRDSGTTILFVSHSMGMVKKFCTDAVLLHRGHMIASGAPDEIVDEYRDLLEKGQKVSKNAERDRKRGHDHGDAGTVYVPALSQIGAPERKEPRNLAQLAPDLIVLQQQRHWLELVRDRVRIVERKDDYVAELRWEILQGSAVQLPAVVEQHGRKRSS